MTQICNGKDAKDYVEGYKSGLTGDKPFNCANAFFSQGYLDGCVYRLQLEFKADFALGRMERLRQPLDDAVTQIGDFLTDPG